MKKAILLSAVFALFFVNCSEDEGDIDTFGPNTTIVGFADDFTSNQGTNIDDAIITVPVDLISYANETLPTSDVTVQYEVDASSTAVAGVDYDVPTNASVTIPAGSTVATFPITIHPSAFDPESPRTLVLNLTSASNAVVGLQYSQITITLQGVCVSELEGVYSSVGLRVETGTQYFFTNEDITKIGLSTYETEYIAGYHGVSSPPGIFVTTANPPVTGPTNALASPTALLTFTEVCGKLKVDTQNLANYYTNEVRQTPAQFEISNVDEETGVITIAYSIFFSGNTIERPFISVYTPL